MSLMEDMTQYMDLFKEEAAEILQNLNEQLLALEKDPHAKPVVDELFRAVHSLKGMAATMGFDDVANLTHKMENLMDKVRKEKIEATTPLMNLMFKAADVLQALLDQVGSENPAEIDFGHLVDQLEKTCSEDFTFSKQEKKTKPASRPVEAPQDNQQELKKSPSRNTIRVKLEHLDNLTNLVGELVISKARLDQLEDKHNVPELAETLDRVKAILGDLQHEVMGLRMVPVGQVFNRFPRMVRDMAQEIGKELEFTIEGSEIELDRTMLDEIGESLVHLLRNAVGHGIETPKEREKEGKPSSGRIHLIARREKEGAVIEVSDDGRGIDLKKMREVAVKKGFISEQEANTIDDQEVIQLVCLPGFTSADQATSLCGRGVGVDAVKAKIVSLGGSLSVKSELGKGARFIMRLPPSMAIIKALLVKAGGVTCAIPLKNVAEVVKLKEDELRWVDNKNVAVIHDELVELIELSQFFDRSSGCESQKGSFPVVIAEVDDMKKGLIVEAILYQQDVVIKPLNAALQSIGGLGGATILGDGKVAPILDLRNLSVITRRKGRVNENARVN